MTLWKIACVWINELELELPIWASEASRVKTRERASRASTFHDIPEKELARGLCAKEQTLLMKVY